MHIAPESDCRQRDLLENTRHKFVLVGADTAIVSERALVCAPTSDMKKVCDASA